ncbi:BICD family-like cargo adapter 1 isoform X2 [Narcine bancroftii]|uniref:BICD family-like cargo adapter 1 isoform X2 n=1 Tax=Narcine bancroftii TaxID=1343680 RepID=UPI003831FD57
MKSPLEEDFFHLAPDRVGEVSAFVDHADLLSLLGQREREVHLAAELGKALLTENQDLKKENNRLEVEYCRKLEELEQEKYALRLKYEGKESEWEARVAELEGDLERLQQELQNQQQYVHKVEKVKADMECDLSEQNQKLMEQLRKATKVEQTLAHEIHALRTMFTRKEFLLHDNTTRAQSLQAELTQSQEDFSELQALNRQLQRRLQELSEHQVMQESTSCNASLLSEIEQSLETETWEAEKDQIKTEIEKIHQELLTLLGVNCSDSLTGCQTPSLQAALSHLKDLVHTLVHDPATLVKLQHTDLMNLRMENDTLRGRLENSDDQHLQQAIHERDTAIMKKNAVEVELAKCQKDMKSLNSQLLETIQQKVDLSQELEAWQDDMQVIINQQLRNQQQAEQNGIASTENSSENTDSKHLSFLQRTRSQIPEGKGFFSLFRR